jgi:hypothetical protein
MKESSHSNVPASLEKSSALASSSSHLRTGTDTGTSAGRVSAELEATSTKADLCLFGGFGLIIVGVFMLFSHMVVFPSMAVFGFGGGGVGGGLILILLLGLGVFFYDYKNKFGWLLIAFSLAAIVISVIATMRIGLQSMSMFSLLLLFAPLVFGAGLVAKGIRQHAQIKADKQGLSSTK